MIGRVVSGYHSPLTTHQSPNYGCLPATRQVSVSDGLEVRSTKWYLNFCPRVLVDEAQSLMLQNTETLARVIRPNLFDKKGRPIKRLITQAIHAKAKHKTRSE